MVTIGCGWGWSLVVERSLTSRLLAWLCCDCLTIGFEFGFVVLKIELLVGLIDSLLLEFNSLWIAALNESRWWVGWRKRPSRCFCFPWYSLPQSLFLLPNWGGIIDFVLFALKPVTFWYHTFRLRSFGFDLPDLACAFPLNPNQPSPLASSSCISTFNPHHLQFDRPLTFSSMSLSTVLLRTSNPLRSSASSNLTHKPSTSTSILQSTSIPTFSRPYATVSSKT